MNKGNRRTTKLPMKVEPTCWLAAASGTKVAAACKSALQLAG